VEFQNLRIISKIIALATILMFLLATDTSSYASFTIQDERKLGKEFYEKLKNKGFLIKNPKVNDYINKIGQNILSHTTKSPFHFTFSVIKSSGINAFATPGGYIYVYEGLIKLVENESQLAGVLSHEMAHVKSRHIAQTIEKSQKLSIATLVAILAGAFLGGGGEGTAAIASFSMATASAINLKYSREHEEEADRKGVSYLVRTGYDARGMLDFMKIMRRYEFYSNSIPSYFLTHPGTSERIRYLDGLLQTTYKKRGAETIIGGLNRIKTILALSKEDLNSSLKYLQNELREHPNDLDFICGVAVIQCRTGRTTESLKNFLRALKQSPLDENILRDLGICYFNTGKTKNAIKSLRKAYSINKNDPDIVQYLGKSYETLNNYSTALDLYKRFLRNNPENTNIYYSLAMAYGKTGNPGDSHYNFGIYFKKKNKPKSALFHFKAALKYFPPDIDESNKIKKEINSINH
jgi:predicted Zn-dependent protease